MEDLSQPQETFADSQERQAFNAELEALLPQNQEAAPARVDAMLQQFGAEQHSLVSVGDIEVIGLGNKEQMEALAPAAQIALDRLQARFGGQLEAAFPGLKIYFADGVIDGGGEALADENAVIMDASKAAMSVGEVEDLLVGMGELNVGDWTSKVGRDISYGEITIVHEMGHMLEARAHGEEGTAFADLSLDGAVTKYGGKAHNEDYAEAFFYDTYGLEVSTDRKAILDKDVSSLTPSLAA